MSAVSESSDAIRILLLVPGLAEGHSMIFARRQAERLVRLGFRVEVFDLRSRTSPWLVFQEFRRFRRALKTFRPQVIHAQYGTVTAMFGALGSGEIPLLITFRGSDLNPLPSARGVRPTVARLLSQLAALRAARIVCVSRGLQGRLWWRRSRTTILPTGVDLEVPNLEPGCAANSDGAKRSAWCCSTAAGMRGTSAWTWRRRPSRKLGGGSLRSAWQYSTAA